MYIYTYMYVYIHYIYIYHMPLIIGLFCGNDFRDKASFESSPHCIGKVVKRDSQKCDFGQNHKITTYIDISCFYKRNLTILLQI